MASINTQVIERVNVIRKEVRGRNRTLNRVAPAVTGVGKSGQWQIVFKAWNDKEHWFKTTKALQVHGGGCLVQTSNHQDGAVTDTLVYLPGVRYRATPDDTGGGFLYQMSPLERFWRGLVQSVKWLCGGHP